MHSLRRILPRGRNSSAAPTTGACQSAERSLHPPPTNRHRHPPRSTPTAEAEEGNSGAWKWAGDLPDAAELLAGTDPLDVASTFHIHSLQSAADGIHLQWSPLRHRRLAKPRLPTVPGKTYRVEYSEDLTQNHWSILLDNIPGTGTLRTVIDPLSTTLPKCFYRVVITAP